MTFKPLVKIVLLLGLSIGAHGQQNSLQSLVSDLQNNPSDRALRERIIKLALETKPPLAIPREAAEIEGAAEYIVTNAKSEADFAKAASEFERASSIAPWAAADYYNAALMYEKAKMPEKALPNYELYLLAAPDAADFAAVVKKIGAMKFAAREADEKRRQAEEQQRQAAAAAQREYERTAAIREFRRYVEGKSFRLLWCFGGGKIYDGCNAKEFNGKNWGPAPGLPAGSTPPSYYWEFANDAAYLKVGTQYLIRVRQNPASPADLIWESPDLLKSDHNSRNRDWKYDMRRAYLQLSPDFSQIVVGNGPLDPKTRRQYWMYKTP